MPNTLEAQFTRAMLDNYEQGKAIGLNSPRFRQMVRTYGGQNTADKLLASANPAEGFTNLILTGNPDNLRLSVEYLVLRNQWKTLFTDEQLAIAVNRLNQVGCPLPTD
jgi:hypothetical protein